MKINSLLLREKTNMTPAFCNTIFTEIRKKNENAIVTTKASEILYIIQLNF